jgi:hypothetical protein
MTTFGPRLDKIVRLFTAGLIQVVEGEVRKNEATRKAEANARPVQVTERVTRVSTSNGRATGARLLNTTFQHPDRNGRRIVLMRFAPDALNPTPTAPPTPLRRR